MIDELRAHFYIYEDTFSAATEPGDRIEERERPADHPGRPVVGAGCTGHARDLTPWRR
ncbi:MAG: hypothetical protein R3F60_19010 [bacterium]